MITLADEIANLIAGDKNVAPAFRAALGYRLIPCTACGGARTTMERVGAQLHPKMCRTCWGTGKRVSTIDEE